MPRGSCAGIALLGKVRELFRVKAVDPKQADLLAVGADLIVDHVHFLLDGEPVRVGKTTRMKP